MEVFYTPEDIWRIQEELRLIRSVQAKHARQLQHQAERLSIVERRGDETKVQNLWTSYFPSVHTPANFPQLQPFPSIDPPLGGPFTGFDSQQTQALGTGLPLDEVDVPRRGASRANSVRFDESAIQNHWAPESHSSSEYGLPQRSSSGIGHHPMMERSYSYKSDYKSDGRQSSMRSFDNFSMAGSEHDSSLPSALRPRDVIECNTPSGFDSAPAVIRCWLGMDCSYDSILYAVICSGSNKSSIDMSLVSRCGFKEKIWKENGEDRISLSLFLGSATVATDNMSSHNNTLPRLKVEFTVVHAPERPHNHKLVQISLGSDILSAIKADLLFSKRQMIFSVRDGQKVYVDFEPDALSFDIFTALSRHSFEQEIEEEIVPTRKGKGSIPALDFGDSSEERRIEGVTVEQHTRPSAKDMEKASTPPSTDAPSPLAPLPRQKAVVETPERSPKSSEAIPITTKKRSQDDMRSMTPNPDLPSALDPSALHERRRQTSYELGKGNGETGTTKGPYAAAASKGLPSTGSSVVATGTSAWDTWRKSDSGGFGSLTGNGFTPLTPKCSSGVISSNAPTSGGDSNQRKPSRSMKVLRPSVSKSTSNPAQTSTLGSSQGQDENTKFPYTPASAPFSPFSSNGFSSSITSTGPKPSRSSSLEASRPTTQTKTRSSTNVVGGATAFKWMSNKSGTGSGSGGGSGGSGTD